MTLLHQRNSKDLVQKGNRVCVEKYVRLETNFLSWPCKFCIQKILHIMFTSDWRNSEKKCSDFFLCTFTLNSWLNLFPILDRNISPDDLLVQYMNRLQKKCTSVVGLWEIQNENEHRYCKTVEAKFGDVSFALVGMLWILSIKHN